MCGYNRCSRALELHHLNPEDKIDSVNAIIKSGYAVSRLKVDLKTCVLLCSNCHSEFHEGLKQIPADVTTFDEEVFDETS